MISFTSFIVIFLVLANVLSLYYVDASPVHYYKRGDKKTHQSKNHVHKNKNNVHQNKTVVSKGFKTTDTSSQVVVGDVDVTEFRFWSKYANAAYCDVTDWKCGAACETPETKDTRLVKFFNRAGPRDNSCYVAMNDKEKAIVVAYRGTADIQSFFQNFQFSQAPFFDKVNAKVHAGFLETYNSTRDEMTSLIKKLVSENPTYKVVVTGHSLGGALATFQTLDLIGTPGLNPSNLFTYTYGEPRPGDDAFASLIDKSGFPFFRVVNKADLVPHLPPENFKYKHFAPQFWIRPDNKTVECKDGEDPTCSDSEKAPTINLFDHARYFDTFFLLTCLKK